MKKSTFVKEVTKEILSKNSSLFLGAGVSVGSGFSDWKSLMTDICDELELDINRENDMISIAQYYQNRIRNRNKLNQKIIEEFDKKTCSSELLTMICQLPVNSIWTTNYDKLIEKEFENINKILDIKIRDKDLAVSKPNKDATLFKIHGDISEPDKAVITRDDYERFDTEKALFIKYLTSELVSKSFIFVGYSFNDPNFNQILSKIRVQLIGNQRNHYYIVKKECDEYEKIKQKLKIEDLLEYGIQTLEIENYAELVEIFDEIRHNVYKNNIFISGSADSYDNLIGVDETKLLISDLTKFLVLNDFTIVNGHGLGVGEHVVRGIVQGLAEKDNVPDNPYIIKVFPQNISKRKTKDELWTSLRENLISQCRTSIFMLGNQLVDHNIELSKGIIEEFNIALKHKHKIILISATGYQTKSLADRHLVENFQNVVVVDSNESNQIINEVINCIKQIGK